MALFAMTAFGIAEVIGAPVMGKCVDTMSAKYANFVTVASLIFVIFVTVWNLTHLKFGPMSYFMCALWGV